MKTAKIYQVSDLFYTAWKDLNDLTHIRVYAGTQNLAAIQDKSSTEYGLTLISILRLLRKNKSLVNKIDVAQAVDIYNDLKFLEEPWYYFPTLKHDLLWTRPDPELARSSFDRFIYADNEFSGFLFAKDNHEKYLRRLAVTLYGAPGETVFDKEMVEEREAQIKTIDAELLMLVFYTFGHVRQKVMKRCKMLLPPAPKTEETKKPQPTGPMWYNIKHQAAKTLVFGDFENVGRTNMYYVLDHLEILCKEREEQRRAKH